MTGPWRWNWIVRLSISPRAHRPCRVNFFREPARRRRARKSQPHALKGPPPQDVASFYAPPKIKAPFLQKLMARHALPGEQLLPGHLAAPHGKGVRDFR